jgi:hypothetical protein
MYAAVQWPIRYASLSHDGTLLAVAGRNGLTHYSSNTGRWKFFTNEEEESAFTVKGGMVWFHHVLIVATESNKGNEVSSRSQAERTPDLTCSSFQLRLYSRDQDLSEAKCLDIQRLPHAVVTMALRGTALLVLGTDNTIYHYVITTAKNSIRLVISDSMSLQGLIPSAGKVRSLIWLQSASE